MKTRHPGILWLWAVGVAVTPAAGCGTQDAAPPTVEERADEGTDTGGTIPATLQQRARQLEAGLNALNQRLTEAGEDLGEDVRRALPELNARATEVRTLIEALSRHSGDALARFREGAAAALEELEQAYTEATAHLDE